ncbi:MAG: glycosyltransferase [Candidatus Woesearchaeota archaeon]|jgi:glycosyltransferase involved in cell wall biosynthesis
MVYFSEITLAAIVRNELDNPAGGIISFVDSLLPFLGAGVIVDTGSTDGTRETLDEMTRKYPHLKIYDHRFKGFADARNISLSHVGTEYALVLDADERIKLEGLERLRIILDTTYYPGHHFPWIPVFPNFTERKTYKYQPHNPRLFSPTSTTVYTDITGLGEELHWVEPLNGYKTNIPIYHYLHSDAETCAKDAWYRRVEEHIATHQSTFLPHWKT